MTEDLHSEAQGFPRGWLRPGLSQICRGTAVRAEFSAWRRHVDEHRVV
jgi:hypothetical protein